jgi:Ca2+-binding RTX toxin-like protein
VEILLAIVLSLGGGGVYLAGTDRADVLRGTPFHDVLHGRKGADRLYGLGGADRLEGQNGDDLLVGGAGADYVLGSLGNDRVVGGAGKDLLDGNAGNDVIDARDPRKFVPADCVPPPADRKRQTCWDPPLAEPVFGGGGNDRILSRDGRLDAVRCQAGYDVVVADRRDRVHGCELVRR